MGTRGSRGTSTSFSSFGTSDIARFSTAFPEEDFYVPPEEALRNEIERTVGGHFNPIHHETALRADVYLRGDDPLHAWAFPRRRRMRVDDLEVRVAPIEYVILRKLEYYRMSGSDRHLRDVGMMLEISGELIDSRELDWWVERLELGRELQAARKYAG